MPHATSDEMMGGMDEELALAMQHANVEAQDAWDHDFDQADKADDAQDYEDFDDDDLPDEVEAENPLDEDVPAVNGFSNGGANGHAYTNGYHDAQEPHSEDLFGDDGLFGERSSSPEQERRPQTQPQQRPGGLALPSKSGVSMSTYPRPIPQQIQQSRQRMPQQSPSSMSPPSFRSDGYSPAASPSIAESEDELEGETDKHVILQMKLMRMAKDRSTLR